MDVLAGGGFEGRQASPPWVVPGFAEERELGRGATGRVVAAVHVSSGFRVAIKYLSPAYARDPEFLGQFRAEAAVLRSLADPHVVWLLDYVEAPGEGVAIVMELVTGVSLHAMITQQGPATPESALCVLKGSLLGLQAAHAAGVVHRNYKPENVLVDGSGASKLTDFGIVPRAGDGEANGGTAQYMAPEQWDGSAPSPATDIYAATAVFFECLTGKVPFSGSAAQLRAAHAAAAVPVEQVDEPLRELIRRGMAKEPAARPADAGRFVAELEATAAAAYGADWESRGRSQLAERAAALLLLIFGSAPSAAAGTGTTTASTSLGSGAKAATRADRARVHGWRAAALFAALFAAVAGGIVGVSALTRHGSSSTTSRASAPAGTEGTSLGTHGLTHPEGVVLYLTVFSGTSSEPGQVIPVDTAAETAGRPVTVGIWPVDIAVTPDGKIAYVVNERSGTVTPINTATDTPGAPIPVAGGPNSIVITPDGKSAYVTCYDGSVALIRTATNAVTTVIPHKTGWIYAPAIAIAGDGKSAFVASPDTGTVIPVNAATGTLGSAIPLTQPADPVDIVITPDGKTVYVADFGRSTVTPIRTATNTAGAPIILPGQPLAMAMTPDGKTVYVASGQGSSGVVTPISTATNTAGPPIRTGATASEIIFTPDSKTAYLNNRTSDTVTPIDTAARAVKPQIKICGTPDVIAIAPNGTTVYAVSNACITPINTKTGTAGASIRLAMLPQQLPAAVAITPVPKVPPVFPPPRK